MPRPEVFCVYYFVNFASNIKLDLKFSDGDGPILCRVKSRCLFHIYWKYISVWVDPHQFLRLRFECQNSLNQRRYSSHLSTVKVFIGEPHIYYGCSPHIFNEDPTFCWRPPSFCLRFLDAHWRPPYFHCIPPELLGGGRSKFEP